MRLAALKLPLAPRDWLLAVLSTVLVALVLFMARLEPLFQAVFPDLDPPVYRRESFLQLMLDHLALVLVSSLISVSVGVGAG